jgi:predicted RNA-binding Zn-ribbon protein involved in translation (DUF1610 family)
VSKTTQRVLCEACRSDLTGPAEHTDESIFRCPTCGQSDTYGNVTKEAHAYLESLVSEHLSQKMADIAQGNRFMTFTPSSRPKRTFRFILDDVPLG